MAYLTAYSAFALYGYLPTLQGLGLLALTAIGAGVFAVTRSAQSLAVLSMVGAFIAPAFAVDDPGPQVVYRYYVAISLLVLAMVAVRGWRPLIHLSFLFTLAGSAFFAWTADYFSAANAQVLLPLIAMLVAVHVAMPLFERRWARGRVVESLDTIYLLALPLVASPDRADHRAVACRAVDGIVVVRGHLAGRRGLAVRCRSARAWPRTPSSDCCSPGIGARGALSRTAVGADRAGDRRGVAGPVRAALDLDTTAWHPRRLSCCC